MQECVFEDLGGNALLLAGYAERTLVDNNEFVRLGDSAVRARSFVSSWRIFSRSRRISPMSRGMMRKRAPDSGRSHARTARGDARRSFQKGLAFP